MTEAQRERFEENLAKDPHFLRRGLYTLLNYPGLVIVADFPPGPGPALQAMSALAEIHLVLILAYTASVSLLLQIENNRLIGQPLNNKLGQYFVLNRAITAVISAATSPPLCSSASAKLCWASCTAMKAWRKPTLHSNLFTISALRPPRCLILNWLANAWRIS
nr:cellulose synthase operon protein YhjQ [Candidatus Pantoea persica]